MKCPHCPDTTLVMTDRQGIEIDYCPQCRGVWLDRGELDKLIERSTANLQAPPVAAAPQMAQRQAPAQAQPHPYRQPDFEDSDFRRRSGYGYKKPKSWLSEIFD